MIRPAACLPFAGLLLFPAVAFSLDTREIFKIAELSVVVVLASDAKGERNTLASGVIVGPLDVVTTCKSVDSAADIVVTQGSALRKARLQYSDRERDLCRLHIEEPLPAGRPAAIAPSTIAVEVGQDIFAISSPRGIERTISRIMVSGMRETAGTSGRLIQIDGHLSGGSIGGGLFDQNAMLVAIVTSQFRQGDDSTLALPAGWIAELPQRNADLLLAAATPAPSAVASSSPAGTQSAPLPAWIPRVGDRWKYKVTYNKQDIGTVSMEIVEAHEKTVRELVRYDRSAGFTRNREIDVGFNFVKFLPTVALPGGYQVIELAPYIAPDTPFAPGKGWSEVPGEFAPQGGSNTQVSNSQVKVVGKEKVRVPAGEFTAWKIESTSERIYAVNQFFVAHCTFWYAPEIKRAIKMRLAYISPMDVLSNTQVLELIAFEPPK